MCVNISSSVSVSTIQVYNYLTDNLSKKESQELFSSHSVIFVPETPGQGHMGRHTEAVAGYMLGRQEVWWADSTGLLVKYHQSLKKHKSPLAKTRVVSFTSVFGLI